MKAVKRKPDCLSLTFPKDSKKGHFLFIIQITKRSTTYYNSNFETFKKDELFPQEMLTIKHKHKKAKLIFFNTFNGRLVVAGPIKQRMHVVVRK